jgi:cytochrome c oxidase subunit 4
MDAHASPAHVVPLRVYLGVFTALLVLTGLTVWVSTLDLGIWNTPVAVAIAIVKATLVILFFMHVKYGHKLIAVVAGAAFFWLFQLLAGTIADYLTRGGLGVPGS